MLFGIRALVSLSIRHQQQANIDHLMAREHDLRDVEMDKLRRQVQLFQELLEHMETLRRDDVRRVLVHEASDRVEEDVNPLHRAFTSSDERAIPRPRRDYGNIDLKVNILDL